MFTNFSFTNFSFTNFSKAVLLLTVFLTLGLGTTRPAAAYTYTVTDLGQGAAFGINSSGQVVGQTNLTGGVHHAFLYTGSAVVDLGVLPSGTNSRAYAINNTTPYGTVVGVSDTTNPVIPPHGSPYTVNVSHATRFVYNGTSVTRTDLGTLVIPTQTWPPDMSTSVAYAINDSSVIVGSAGTLASNAVGRAFTWSGSMTSLGTLGGMNSWAYGINANGIIVGGSDQSSNNGYAHAFKYDTMMRDIGTLGTPTATTASVSQGINSLTSYQIVGISGTTSGGTDGFLYQGTTMTDIGSIDPAAINSSGVIVGSMSGYATIRQSGVTTNLNTLISPTSGFTLTDATAINDNGWIACDGTDSSGNTHALLLKP